MEFQMPVERVEAGFTALEVQPSVLWDVLLPRIAEKWLDGQRKAYRR